MVSVLFFRCRKMDVVMLTISLKLDVVRFNL